MAEKQSILGRISQLAKANINAILDRAEDPEKMLDQMVRDYSNSIAEAEDAVAVTIGNLRLAEADYREDIESARQWGDKAEVAVNKAKELTAAGNTEQAQKFTDLAKIALEKQIAAEQEARAAEPMISSQQEVVAKLKDGLAQMHGKLNELQSKRDQLVARKKSVDAQNQVQEAIGSINVMDPTSEISRFEEQIRRQEAITAGRAEAAAATFGNQFALLEDAAKSSEVEERLQALQNGEPQKAIEGRDFTSY